MNGDEWVCIRNESYFTYLAMMNRRQEEKFLDLLPINPNTQRPYPLPPPTLSSLVANDH